MKKYFLIICISCLVYACIPTGGGNPFTRLPEYRGLYVNKFDTILGDTAKENNLLRWAKRENFNALTLYGLSKIVSEPSIYNTLAAFILKAKTDYGFKEVNATRGKASDFTNYVNAYNNSRTNTAERFNWANLEREFWNGDNTFTYSFLQLQQMKNWGLTQTPVVKTEEYIGWLRDSSGAQTTPARRIEIADSLVMVVDRMLIHDYQQNVSFGYVEERLDTLGQRAIAQGKILDVAIIFSAETPTYSGAYFSTHPFVDAYNIIYNANSAATYPGKAGIRLVGYQIYNYSHARNARP
ncbi:MAG: hypothetical protein R2739_10460 [Chitinophagales bacterium]|nr:hypothetical protein [Bacteroidota bacterium]